MSKFVVADSSCLISLSRIGKLEVLHELFGEIIIPEAVYSEVVIRGEGRIGAEEVKKAKWIKKQKVQNALSVVVMPLEDYQALTETKYLLNSPANAARLVRGIEEIEDLIARGGK